MSTPPSSSQVISTDNENEATEAHLASGSFLKVVTRTYKESFAPLVSFLRSKFGNGPPPPEDIAQSAFERLLRSESVLKTDNPKSYLWRVACNLAISENRHRIVVEKHVEATKPTSTEEKGYDIAFENVLYNRGKLKKISSIIDSMPPKRKMAFLLVRVQGLSKTEAAKKMGISRPAVTKHLTIALQILIERTHKDRTDDGEC